MAAARKTLQSLFLVTNSPLIWRTGGCRCYSQYAPHFKNPIIDKKELDRIVKESSKEEIFSSFRKAPPNYLSCSIFYHEDVDKFANHIMSGGRKAIARHVVYAAFTRVKHMQIRKWTSENDEEKKKEIELNPLNIFLGAVENCKPMLDLMKIKRSGSWYRVPMAIKPHRARFVSMKWLIEAANEKNMKVPLEETLAKEFVDAFELKGKAINKKIEFHKLCEANKGYVGYRWA